MKKQTNNPPFKRVALMGRRRAQDVPETVVEVRNFLKSIDIELVIEKHTAEAIGEDQLPVVDPKSLGEHCDLIVVVGGDGSLINAAHVASKQQLPLLGINRGRVGFLTDIHPDELDKIQSVLDGDYTLEDRILLKASMALEDGSVYERLALNDLVLLPGDSARMFDYELRINDDLMYRQRADGLIIATPTGSTAYSLSAGGPIIHPGLNTLVLCPMFPHALSSRPIVIDADNELTLTMSPMNETEPELSADGQERKSIPLNSTITISKHTEALQLVHPSDYDYYRTLREKLGWNDYKVRS